VRSLLAAKTSAALAQAKQQIASNALNSPHSATSVSSKFESDVSDRIRALRADLDRLDARWREATERVAALERAVSSGAAHAGNANAGKLLMPRPGKDAAADVAANNVVVDPDPASWIKDKMRSQVLRILNDKVYDVTADGDFGMRLDLLNDVHRELDQIVNQCACGSDGASNNDLQRQVYLNLSMTVRPTSSARPASTPATPPPRCCSARASAPPTSASI
jgi:hypothetical protein